MSDAPKLPVGAIGWTDIAVPDADTLRDFYAAVVGWKWDGFDMGGYSDYVMMEPESGKAVGGICHARGGNAGLPAAWLVYITVADLERSVEEVKARGGAVLKGPAQAGPSGRFAVIRDPAGAVAALFQSA
jgi:predicted enzyme related to lactoylglutathione lyase